VLAPRFELGVFGDVLGDGDAPFTDGGPAGPFSSRCIVSGDGNLVEVAVFDASPCPRFDAVGIGMPRFAAD